MTRIIKDNKNCITFIFLFFIFLIKNTAFDTNKINIDHNNILVNSFVGSSRDGAVLFSGEVSERRVV